jgi:ankyrin repeat protein
MILIFQKTTIKKRTINQKRTIMKKSIVYLGVALVAFTNVALATNSNSLTASESVISVYYGSTPLGIAISKGDVEVVKKFIEYGSNVNEKSNGMTPLMLAARYNRVEIIKILLSKGADLNAKDEKGYTALKHAELSQAFEAAQLLKQA